jgi:16S rRNA (guanine966-N2)-methyltransferase
MVRSNIKIIAGKHRGKKLYMANKETTRSSKNILKESVFNTLQFEVVDSIFVEVFAGTGSIGLEALSRGAKFAYFLEKDPHSFKVLEHNIKACKEEENSEVILLKSAAVASIGFAFNNELPHPPQLAFV